MTDSNAILQLRGITRDFKMGAQTVHVLKGIDLDIFKNQYVALMGPSGSGKSTLMNLLGCLDTPTEGTYVLNGSDVSALDDNALSGNSETMKLVSFSKRSTYLPRSTALENVALPLVYAGWGKEERIARAQRGFRTSRSWRSNGPQTEPTFRWSASTRRSSAGIGQ